MSRCTTSLRMDPDAMRVRDYIRQKTGLTQNEIVTRLLYAYAAGNKIPGLPTLAADNAAKARMREWV